MRIGRFHRAEDGFVGRLETLVLDVPLRILSISQNDNPKAPTWRVYRDMGDHGIEVGSGWTYPARSGGTILGLQLDCPVLGEPLRANLVPDNHEAGAHILIWSRARGEQQGD